MTGALAACSSRNVQLVSITDRDILSVGAGTRTATVTFSSDGTIKNQDGTVLETWRNGGPSSAYDIYAQVNSGSPTGSATGTWLNLATDPAWTVEDTTVNGSAVIATFQFSIAHTGGGATIDTGFIRIEAERTS